jgi:hypothetical protein
VHRNLCSVEESVVATYFTCKHDAAILDLDEQSVQNAIFHALLPVFVCQKTKITVLEYFDFHIALCNVFSLITSVI